MNTHSQESYEVWQMLLDYTSDFQIEIEPEVLSGRDRGILFFYCLALLLDIHV
jgi:hypothetical protein